MAAGETLKSLKPRFGAGRFVEANGARMHYARLGQGKPLVMVHGWPEFWLTWRHNLPVLARHFDVIAPDLRGFGESRSLDRPPDAPLTPSQIADDLAALLDVLGVEQAGFVAHDIGANAMQTFARVHPQRVAGLFFFNCPHPGIGRRWADAESLPETWYQYFNQVPFAPAMVGQSREACRLYLGYVLARWSHDPACFAEDLDLWVDNFMTPGALDGGFAWYKGVDAARRALVRDGPPDLPRIDHPTRVLWGGSDKVLRPEWIDTLPDTFSDLQVAVLPNAGHFVHYEAPAAANEAVLAFFREGVFG